MKEQKPSRPGRSKMELDWAHETLRDTFDWYLLVGYRYLIGCKKLVSDYYGPLIPYITEGYFRRGFKILIVAQHTGRWNKLRESVDNRLMYDDLRVTSKGIMDDHINEGTPLGDFFLRLNSILGNGKELPFVWTNLLKIHENGKIPEKEGDLSFRKIFLPMLILLESEIDELRPDVVLFLQHPGDDKHVKRALRLCPDTKYTAVKDYSLQEFMHFKLTQDIDGFKHFKLDQIDCYRLPHPDYLHEKQLTDKYFSDLKVLLEGHMAEKQGK